MNVNAKIKYSFELSARELTHIRHALNLATSNSTGAKSKQFQEIHDELTKQVNKSLETYKEHFTAMLEMIVTNTETKDLT